MSDQTFADFPTRLRALIRQSGLTAKEIAERAGITPQYLNDLAKGRRDAVSFAVAERLSQALGCGSPFALDAPVRVIVPYSEAVGLRGRQP